MQKKKENIISKITIIHLATILSATSIITVWSFSTYFPLFVFQQYNIIVGMYMYICMYNNVCMFIARNKSCPNVGRKYKSSFVQRSGQRQWLVLLCVHYRVTASDTVSPFPFTFLITHVHILFGITFYRHPIFVLRDFRQGTKTMCHNIHCIVRGLPRIHCCGVVFFKLLINNT